MADRFDTLIQARLEKLRLEDPERARKLEAAFARLKEAEAKLEEMSKNDARDASRMRAYGVID